MVKHAGGQRQLAYIQSLGLQGWIFAERLLQEGGGSLTSPEGVVGDNPAQEMSVGSHAEHGGVLQGPDQAATGFVPVLAPGNDFGQHGVVVGCDAVSGANARIVSKAFSLCWFKGIQWSGLGGESVSRILRIEPHFNGVAIELYFVLREWQLTAFSNGELPGHQILAGNQLGDRVLHLQAGVHFQEVEVPMFVDQELDGAGAFVVTGQRRFHCGLAHGLSQFGCDKGRGRFFDHFLVPALDRAVSFAQVDGVAVTICEYLNFHVPGLNHGFFEDQFVVAEGLLGFRPGPFDVVGQFGFALNQAHAAASTAGGGFDHQREADVFGGGDQFVVAGTVTFDRALITGHDGYAGFLHGDFGAPFAAHQFDGRGGRANEHQAGVFAGVGEGGILGEEAVAGVDAVGAGLAGSVEDSVVVQVGSRYLGRANANGFVSQFHVHGFGVSLGVDGHGAVTQ